jgi:hypothetical protein
VVELVVVVAEVPDVRLEIADVLIFLIPPFL